MLKISYKIPKRLGEFRITTDTLGSSLNMGNMHYIHRKFYWWWIKWCTIKIDDQNRSVLNNIALNENLIDHLKNGRYQFSTGENLAYYFLLDKNSFYNSQYSVEYVESAEEYLLNHAEDFI